MQRRLLVLVSAVFGVAGCVAGASNPSRGVAPDASVLEPDLELDEVEGRSAALSRPGNWVPDAVGGFVRYDDAPAWQGGRNCTGNFTAGARELSTYLRANFRGISSIGGYSCRQNTADLAKTSVHGTGRALDIMVPTARGAADNDVGDAIARWLIQHATEVGVQYIIWDRTSYNSSRTGTKYRTYTGPNPHVDHLHVELNLEGANRRTPWFAGMQPPPSAPPPAPPPPRPLPPAPPSGGAPQLRSPLRGAERVTSHVSHTKNGGLVNYRCDRISRSGHKGTDFGVPIGTPVFAAAAGTVIRTNDNCSNAGFIGSRCGGGFGNHVMILHASGRATLYGHLSPGSGLPRVGQRVDCGDRLGLSGGSGNSSGPHLHFEVRDGVSNASDYFSKAAKDPYGGACSTQAAPLWTGGSPGDTCGATGGGAMPRGDDSAFVSATIPGRQRVAAGARVSQTWTLRNTGSTTWRNPQYGLARTAGPAFGGPGSVGLPDAQTVAPGQTAQFRFDATAPSEPGVHRATFRMTQGAAFGATVFLELEVAASGERGCRSATLGRDVPANSCVQVSYAGCGQASCAWYQCTNGAWSCAARSACDDGASFANAQCAQPSQCGAQTGCGMCAGTSGCVWCASSGTCVDSTAQCEQRVTSRAACDACVPDAGLCNVDGQCCGASGSSAVRCLAGFCSDTSQCGVPARACSTRDDCCTGLTCAPSAAGGARQCCLRADDPCVTSEDCCGEMTCDAGRCVARTRGQSCASTQDCAGASFCTNGVCQ